MDSRGRVRILVRALIYLLASAGVEVGWVRVEIYHTLRYRYCACVAFDSVGGGGVLGGFCNP